MREIRALPLFERMIERGSRPALIDEDGSCSYADLIADSAKVAAGIIEFHGKTKGQRHAILLPAGIHFVTALFGVWRSGNIAVPLSTSHTAREWRHMLADSGATSLITERAYVDRAGSVAGELECRLMDINKLSRFPYANVPEVGPEESGMIVYTSGTTSDPKGVVHTHASIAAQIRMLVEAWQWSEADRTINCLPLHHVHGLVNILLCGLWSGAEIELSREFKAEQIWQSVIAGEISLFMAVPTIYTKLIKYWKEAGAKEQKAMSKAARKLRLWVSGSAALPVPVFEQWREISGQAILERYGMTEIGMALSNPYSGDRRPGTVGQPLPGVEVDLLKKDGEMSGELLVCSPGLFKEYWNRPESTSECLRDGWFRTGDVAELVNGYYRILGRSSVDILKSGGYKISALEIEAVLLRHKSIEEVAVVGIEDETWGERVAAVIVEKPGSDITPGWLKGWAGKYLAAYKLPTVLVKLNSLPRNAMGKVNKQKLKEVVRAEAEIK